FIFTKKRSNENLHIFKSATRNQLIATIILINYFSLFIILYNLNHQIVVEFLENMKTLFSSYFPSPFCILLLMLFLLQFVVLFFQFQDCISLGVISYIHENY